MREESKQLIRQAVWNDSQFLSDLSALQPEVARCERTDRSLADVMDYSLVVGVDAVKSELVVGIVGRGARLEGGRLER